MGGNSEVILSHTTNQLHFYKQLLQNFTLDRNIMAHNTTNISFKSGYGLINAEALLWGDTKSVQIKARGNERRCTTNAESLVHSKCMNNVKLCPKTETSNVSE